MRRPSIATAATIAITDTLQRGLCFITFAVLALVSVAQASTITAASCSQTSLKNFFTGHVMR